MADLDFLATGSIGQFWRYEDNRLPSDGDKPEYGWLSMNGNQLELATVDDTEPWEELDGQDIPPLAGGALLGQLPTDAVLILDAWSRGGTRVLAGHHVSTRKYVASTVVGGGVPLSGLRSPRVTAVRAMYQSLSEWAGMVASEEQFTFVDGRINGFTLKLTAPTTETARVDRRRAITVEAKWAVGGPADRRVASMPIAIGCVSDRPVSLPDLLKPLIDVQDLLGMLFVGFVTADNGDAVLDLDEVAVSPHRGSYPLWTARLMSVPPGVSTRSSTSLPLADLRAIGGVAGIARWVRLCQEHPRATSVAVSPARHGTATAEVELLSLGSALEYWVAAHRHLKWAKKPPKVKGRSNQAGFALAITGQAGPAFRTWIGDPDAWCNDFASAYNGLKHDPRFSVDRQLLSDLVVSARFLLLAVLVNRVAGSRSPAGVIFSNYRLSGIGERFRTRYTNPAP